jgi:TonB family protein
VIRQKRFKKALVRLGFLGALFTARLAYGQNDGSPPRVVETVEPVFPEGAGADTAHVVLALVVDETGTVVESKVLESGGEAFDRAALEAANKLRFEPARRGDQAVAARIPFTFDFERKPPPVPPPVPAAVPVAAAAPAPEPTAAPVKEPAEEDVEELDVRGERPPREATSHTLKGEEIRKIPGTNGDLLRSVENLPGVGRPAALNGQLLVRGSGPDETGAFLDGTWIIGAYHFGGITSVVPSELIEKLEFRPGNFSPEYGRLMGGIVELELRSPRKDRLGGLLQIDSLDGRFIFEGPISKSTRFALAGRRSWVDAWIGSAAGSSVRAAPVYYDYQAMLEHDFSRKVTARLTAFGSDDRMKFFFDSAEASDPAEGGNLGLHEAFVRVQGRVDAQLSNDVRWVNKLSWGVNKQKFNMGELDVDVDFQLTQFRSDLRWRLSDALALVTGADLLFGSFDNRIKVPAQTENDGGPPSGPIFGRPLIDVHGSDFVQRQALYALAEVRPIPTLLFTPGVRVDYMSDTGKWTVDPRIATRFDLHRGPSRSTLKAAAGIFHQAPNPNESMAPWGTPGVRPAYAEHYSAGFEQAFGGKAVLSTEVFAKRFQDLIVAEGAENQTESGTVFRNTGNGRAYGVEWLLKTIDMERFQGWLAYTLSRGERREHPTESYHLYQYDQTHILNVIGSYYLGRGWTAGARFRYVSGRPYTSYTGSVVDHDAGAYAPISSTSQYDNRSAAFHRLDLRIEKLWDLKPLKLTAYLDVQNVYNYQAEEGRSYNYNYSRSAPLNGLPILPIIGIRGEL